MIYNGIFSFYTMYFLFGVVCTLLVLCAALWIVLTVMKWRIRRMKKQLGDQSK